MTNEASPVDAAIAEAEAASANVPATQTQQSTAVAQAPTPTPLSLSDIQGGSLNVDEWLKVNEFGLMSGASSGKFFQSLKVMIDMKAVMPFEGIRFGNAPVTYLKTYDMANCTTGGTWPQALERAVSADPKAKPYRGADIPMTALEDIKVGDDVVIKAGTILGHSTTITNRQNLSKFIDELAEAGLDKATVEVEIVPEPRKNKNGHEWGVLKFNLIGEVEDSE